MRTKAKTTRTTKTNNPSMGVIGKGCELLPKNANYGLYTYWSDNGYQKKGTTTWVSSLRTLLSLTSAA